MTMRWGVLYKTFPLGDGEEGGLYLDFQRDSNARCSLRAFFFNWIKQLRPRQELAAGHSLYTHG
jgi:hypothetical protein